MINCKPMVLIFFFFLCFTQYLFAQGGVLTAVFPTWKPYGYVAEGKPVGFEIEIFSAVMAKMKISIELEHQPWKRCLYSVKHGLADMVVSALKVKERTAYLYYPDEPISFSRTALFTSTDKDIVFNGSFEAIKDFTIGVTSGFSYGPEFDSSSFLKKDESAETEAVVAKVLLGRNELGVGNTAVIKTIAKRKNASHKIKFLSPLLHSQKLYVGFSRAKNHEDLTTEFSKALVEFKKTSKYLEILKKYNME